MPERQMDKTVVNPNELAKLLAIPQLGRPTIVTPKIIDEEGKEIVRPDVLQAVVQLAQLGQMVKIRKSLEKEEFEGKEDPRTLNATDEIQVLSLTDDFPYTPWITAYFINDGPDPVRISLNRPYAQFELGMGETITVDRAHADERMNIIFYVCDSGETASVRVIGQY